MVRTFRILAFVTSFFVVTPALAAAKLLVTNECGEITRLVVRHMESMESGFKNKGSYYLQPGQVFLVLSNEQPVLHDFDLKYLYVSYETLSGYDYVVKGDSRWIEFGKFRTSFSFSPIGVDITDDGNGETASFSLCGS